MVCVGRFWFHGSIPVHEGHRRFESIADDFSVSWLRKSGAIRRPVAYVRDGLGSWPGDDLMRKDVEQELVRWRNDKEAKLPLRELTVLARDPDEAFAAALGSARASTIVLSLSSWPSHVRVIRDS